MILVVSDTSTLNYLVQLGHAEILGKLFDQVVIPDAVLAELQDLAAPAAVRLWSAALPAWTTVSQPKATGALARLGAGESAAIQLAVELRAAAVLLDDFRARTEARRRGLAVVGTIRVLEMAAEKSLIELVAAFAGLRRLGFRADEDLYESSLARLRRTLS